MRMKAHLVLPLALALAGCGKEAPPPAAEVKTVLAHVVHLGEGDSPAEYSGEVRPRREVAAAFRVAGKLVERRVEVGERVRSGQVLARLDPADLAQGLKGMEAERAAALAERDYARAEAERYRQLRGQGFISQAALDGKETTLKATEERLTALQARTAQARNQTAYTELRADRGGVVAAVLAEAGQVVAAGQAVLRLALDEEKDVAVAVPENRLDEFRAGLPVEVRLWALPGRTFSGRVREVSPQADPVTRTYAARVTVTDPDAAIRLGMTAQVGYRRASGVATLIPGGALFQQARRPAVWVIGPDGRLTLRPVQVLAYREDGVSLSAGLAEGERIVAAGAHQLSAGEVVRVAEARR